MATLFSFVEHLISTFSGLSSHPKTSSLAPYSFRLIWSIPWRSLESIHKLTIVTTATKFPLDLQLLLFSPTHSSTFTNIQSLLPKSDLYFHSHLADPKNSFTLWQSPLGSFYLRYTIFQYSSAFSFESEQRTWNGQRDWSSRNPMDEKKQKAL